MRISGVLFVASRASQNQIPFPIWFPQPGTTAELGIELIQNWISQSGVELGVYPYGSAGFGGLRGLSGEDMAQP